MACRATQLFFAREERSAQAASGMDGIMQLQQRRFRDLLKLNSLPRSRLNSTPLKEYCASLGHKVCHSFSPNAAYSHAVHPLFGRIRYHNFETNKSAPPFLTSARSPTRRDSDDLHRIHIFEARFVRRATVSRTELCGHKCMQGDATPRASLESLIDDEVHVQSVTPKRRVIHV